MKCRHVINSPGSSSLLVMSCSDVTSCSCGAWITNKMLPRRHSRQPSFPNTFNTSPNRWEDRTALKHTHAHTQKLKSCYSFWNSVFWLKNLFVASVQSNWTLKTTATWWGHSERPAESPAWPEQTCRQRSYRPLLLPLQRHGADKYKHENTVFKFTL